VRIIERTYPYIISIFLGFIIYIFRLEINDIENFKEILSATVTFSAIIIAFLSTMVSIFISLTNSEVMKNINEAGGNGLLTSYIAETVIGGLFLVVFSIILFIFLDYKGNFSNLLVVIYISLFSFVIFSSYRILKISLKILTNVLNESSSDKTENKAVKPKINEAP